MPALALDGLMMRFGGLVVTNGVSLTLEPGARHALIGPNGAGKTTLVNLITGRLRPRAGTVRLGGQDVTSLPQHRRTRLGLVRNFQVTNLFPSFSAYENIALAVAERGGRGCRSAVAAGSRPTWPTRRKGSASVCASAPSAPSPCAAWPTASNGLWNSPWR